MSVGLILGEALESCNYCRFVDTVGDFGKVWCALGKKIVFNDIDMSEDGLIPRPDWCPLQEVELVRHGKWIRAYDAVLDRSYFVCSYCDYGIMIKQGEKYCPNCGAKMDGGAK